MRVHVLLAMLLAGTALADPAGAQTNTQSGAVTTRVIEGAVPITVNQDIAFAITRPTVGISTVTVTPLAVTPTITAPTVTTTPTVSTPTTQALRTTTTPTTTTTTSSVPTTTTTTSSVPTTTSTTSVPTTTTTGATNPTTGGTTTTSTGGTSTGQAANTGVATGTVPTASISTTGTALPLTSPTPTAATFTVSTADGQSVSISVPQTFDLTRDGGGQPLTVTTITDLLSTNSAPIFTSALNSTGVLSFNVGGRVNVNSQTMLGDYRGLLVVTAQYN